MDGRGDGARRAILGEWMELHHALGIGMRRGDDKAAVVVREDDHTAVLIGSIDARPGLLPISDDGCAGMPVRIPPPY